MVRKADDTIVYINFDDKDRPDANIHFAKFLSF